MTATVDLGELALPDGSARGIRALLQWGDDDVLHASIQFDEARSGDRVFNDLRLECAEAQWSGDAISCHRGTLQRIDREKQAREPLLRNLDIDYELATGRLTVSTSGRSLGEGDARLQLTGSDGSWQIKARTSKVTAGAWRGLLQGVGLWPQGYDEVDGVVDVDADIHLRRGKIEVPTLAIRSTALSFSGAAIADKADLQIEASTSIVDDQPLLSVSGTLSAGALYVEPGLRIGDYAPGITLEPGERPITLQARVAADGDDGRWQFRELQLDQPGVARFGMRAGAAGGSTLEAELVSDDLGQLYAQHIKSHCTRLSSLCGLEFAGGVTVNALWDAQGIGDLRLQFKDVHADDDRHRFRIAGLQGNLILNGGSSEQASSFKWQRAGWQRLDFGAGGVGMSSRDRSLKVTEWGDVDVLGGTFKVKQLELANVGRRDFAITMQGVLTPIPMQSFSQAMGWPIMQGTLSGVIPGLSYRRGRLELDGDLLVRVFGGSVVVRGLNIDDPFGSSPRVSTDLDVRNIDLEQLTGAFSFGKIEGTLEGEVRNLLLEGWRATAFDGFLQNPADDDRPHRISQKAVDNLSAIGGGISGVLSRGFLRVFQDYSYDRLGLHCRLADGICAMKGVAPAGDGFYIVTRGGLLPPWIDVRGSGIPLPDGRFAVAWNDILLGFKRINSGQMKLQR